MPAYMRALLSVSHRSRVSTHLTSYFLLMSALHAADMYWNGAKSSLVGICIRAVSESGQRSYPTWVTCTNAVISGLYPALPSNVGPSFRLDDYLTR